MTGVRARQGMGAAGIVAGLASSALFLPMFLSMGGRLREYPAILLFDVVCVTAVSFVAGGSLAPPFPAGVSAVGRATAVSGLAWFAIWVFGTSLGVIGIVVGGSGASAPHWQVLGLLIYAVVGLVLLVPLAVALAAQLCLTSLLSRWFLPRLGAERAAGA